MSSWRKEFDGLFEEGTEDASKFRAGLMWSSYQENGSEMIRYNELTREPDKDERQETYNAFRDFGIDQSEGAPQPEAWIPSYTAEGDYSDEVLVKSLELVDLYRDNENTSGLKPQGIAAGAVYAASLFCNEAHHTINEVSEFADASRGVIGKRNREIIESWEKHS